MEEGDKKGEGVRKGGEEGGKEGMGRSHCSVGNK